MKPPKKPAAAKATPSMKIVIDPTDPRSAKVMHDGKALFTIKTDTSGAQPSIIVTVTETHLKSMTSGKTKIALWNANAGAAERSLKLKY
jgi:hypothetical protein